MCENEKIVYEYKCAMCHPEEPCYLEVVRWEEQAPPSAPTVCPFGISSKDRPCKWECITIPESDLE